MTARTPAPDAAKRIIDYLFRTGKFDWAGGRWAAHRSGPDHKDRWPPLAAMDGVKFSSARLMFDANMLDRPETPPLVPLSSDAVFVVQVFRAATHFAPFNKNIPPEEPCHCPMGFWPLVAHNFSIGYSGDIQRTKDEAQFVGDTECVALCDMLLEMRRTAREKCGRIVNEELEKRGVHT